MGCRCFVSNKLDGRYYVFGASEKEETAADYGRRTDYRIRNIYIFHCVATLLLMGGIV